MQRSCALESSAGRYRSRSDFAFAYDLIQSDLPHRSFISYLTALALKLIRGWTEMIHRAVSVLGFMVFAGIAWLLSTNRRKIAWRTIAWGVALQLLMGLIIFRLPGSHRILLWLNDAVLVLLDASKSGSMFLFGPLAASPGETGSVGFILVFQVLPVVIFFAAFTAMLYHLRVLQVFVRLFARLFHRRMRISGAESLSGAANIFLGIESALVVRPYLERMTRSELFLILTTGMATVASSSLGIYVAF